MHCRIDSRAKTSRAIEFFYSGASLGQIFGISKSTVARWSEAIASPMYVLVEAVFTALHAYHCEPKTCGVPYDKGYVVEAMLFGDAL